MGEKADVWQGTLALMILRTLDTIGADARLRHRAPYRADQRRHPVAQLRHALPRPPETRAGRRHCRRVGHVRAQPQGQLLHDHESRPELLSQETKHWEQATAILERFLNPRRSPHEIAFAPRSRLTAFLSRAIGRSRAFDAELESHLQLHVDDNLRAGMTPTRPGVARSSSSAAIDRTKAGLPRPGRPPVLEHLTQDAALRAPHLASARLHRPRRSFYAGARLRRRAVAIYAFAAPRSFSRFPIVTPRDWSRSRSVRFRCRTRTCHTRTSSTGSSSSHLQQLRRAQRAALLTDTQPASCPCAVGASARASSRRSASRPSPAATSTMGTTCQMDRAWQSSAMLPGTPTLARAPTSSGGQPRSMARRARSSESCPHRSSFALAACRVLGAVSSRRGV